MPEEASEDNLMRQRSCALLALLITMLSAAACSGTSVPPTRGSAGEYAVLATTGIFADLARLALGDNATIQSIVPAGVDVHTFEPSPAAAEKIRAADLILLNGLGLDTWVNSLLEAGGKTQRDTLVLGEGLDQTSNWVYLKGGEGSGGVDPHVWMDPKGAALYVQRIADRVSAERPALASAIAIQSAASIKKIQALDTSIAAAFSAVDPLRRKIVTLHDAFAYFARDYGITVVGVVITSPGQDPSAQQIRALIDAIRSANVTALFSERQLPSKVLGQIASETGATVLQDLYSDALGAPPADSYLGAMKANADAILGALQ
jgi:hypothetical protein